MTDYTIATTTEQDFDLIDGWDIALSLQGKPGVEAIEHGADHDGDADAWIVRADGIRLALGVEVEETEDEDGYPTGAQVVGATWTAWESDADGSHHDIETDGASIENADDVESIIDLLAAWAARAN